MFWSILFFITIALLLVLPLVPALHEWRHKKDASPLKVVREYDGNIAFFAASFYRFLEHNFPEFLTESQSMDAAVKGTLGNGTAYQIVAMHGMPAFTTEEIKSNATARLILAKHPLKLPAEMFFESEVYGAQTIVSGNRNIFRAILAQSDVSLGDSCTVIRWAHTESSISFGQRSRLYGRVSAGKEIVLQNRCQFGRMNAPVIRFGHHRVVRVDTLKSIRKFNVFVPDTCMLDYHGARWLFGNALRIPSFTFHRGSLVTRKEMHVKKDTFIIGALKSHREMRLEENIRIDGGVVSQHNLKIGQGCIIKGPVVAGKTVTIGSGCIIGSLECPTTITAPTIHIEEGAIVHGTLWARNMGRVLTMKKTHA
jgi:cytoskeletal protein CcmA (bactofilin family)